AFAAKKIGPPGVPGGPGLQLNLPVARYPVSSTIADSLSLAGAVPAKLLAVEIDGLVSGDDGLPIATEWCMRRQGKIHRSGEEGRRNHCGEDRLHHGGCSEGNGPG